MTNDNVSILPYGLEIDPNCIADGINNLPKDAGTTKELLVKEFDGETWYWCNVNNEQQANSATAEMMRIGVFLSRISNPIYGMSIDEVNDRIKECIKGQPQEWIKDYKDLALKRLDTFQKLGLKDNGNLKNLIKQYGLEKHAIKE